MIPYFEAPTFEVGSTTVTAFRILVVVAVAIQFEMTVRRAPRFGIDRDLATSLVGWAVVLGLVSAHVFDVLMYYPGEFLADPMMMFRSWGSLSSTGGMLGGIAGLVFVAHRKGLSRGDLARFLDIVMFALPFTLATGRLGCALQHDHLGIRSEHFLAVAFPGGARFDLGVLEFGWVALLAGAFLALDRRPRPPGFWLAAFFAGYAPVRFVLDTLRIDDARYYGLTPAQFLSIGAGLLAVGWLWKRRGALVGVGEPAA